MCLFTLKMIPFLIFVDLISVYGATGSIKDPNDIFGEKSIYIDTSPSVMKEASECSSTCSTALRHIASAVLNQYRKNPQVNDFSFQLDFSAEELSILVAFEQHVVSESVANDVLLSALKRTRFNMLHYLPYEYISNLSNNLVTIAKSPQFSIAATIISMLLVMTYLTVYFKSLKLAAFGVFLFIIIVGFGWNWLHAYQKAVAEQERILTFENHMMPAECMRSQRSWSYLIYVFFVGDGAICEKWFEAVNVSPISAVNPSEVFSASIAMIFFQPIKATFDIIEDVSSSFTAGLPVWAAVPVRIVIFVLLFCCTMFFLMWMVLIVSDRDLKLWGVGFGFEVVKPAVLGNRNYVEDVQRREGTCDTCNSKGNCTTSTGWCSKGNAGTTSTCFCSKNHLALTSDDSITPPDSSGITRSDVLRRVSSLIQPSPKRRRSL